MTDYKIKEIIKCKSNCEHLDITEEQQEKSKIYFPHRCLKYNRIIKHSIDGLNIYPDLHRLKECNIKE